MPHKWVKVMSDPYDPYREALVVEQTTVWPEGVAAPSAEERRQIEQRLHAEPQKASQLAYVRLATGFCRQITVTEEDLARLSPT